MRCGSVHARPEAPEQVRGDGQVADLRQAFAHVADVHVDTEDLLQDHHCGTVATLGAGEVGLEGAVGVVIVRISCSAMNEHERPGGRYRDSAQRLRMGVLRSSSAATQFASISSVTTSRGFGCSPG